METTDAVSFSFTASTSYSPGLNRSKNIYGFLRGLCTLAFFLLHFFIANVHAVVQHKPINIPPNAALSQFGLVSLAIVSDQDGVTPGTELQLGLLIQHAENSHTYWRNPGDAGMATKIRWNFPEGWKSGPLLWPIPKKLFVPPLVDYEYEGAVIIPIKIRVPENISFENPVKISAQVSWLVCKTVCTPGEANLELSLPVKQKNLTSIFEPLFREMQTRIPQEVMHADVISDGHQLVFSFEDKEGFLNRIVQKVDPLKTRGKANNLSFNFFPYNEGWIDNSAPQTLYNSNTLPKNKNFSQLIIDKKKNITAPSTAGTLQNSFSSTSIRTASWPIQLAVPLLPKATEQLLAKSEKKDSDFQLLLKKIGEGALSIEGHPLEISVQNGVWEPSIQLGKAIAENTVTSAKNTVTSRDNSEKNTDQDKIFSFPHENSNQLNFQKKYFLDEETTEIPSQKRISPTEGDKRNSESISSDSSIPKKKFFLNTDSKIAWTAIAAAFFGGIILNIMPCVFPVVSLKVLSFSNSKAKISQDNTINPDAFYFTFGVVFCFLILGFFIFISKSLFGTALGWGFQWHSPIFVSVMGILFLLISLNLSGLYEVGVSFTKLGNLEQKLFLKEEILISHEKKEKFSSILMNDFLKNFLSGILTVLVSTPCMAPFMGSALGFAMGANSTNFWLIFLFLGLGMGCPYALLGIFPGLLSYLPRPGRWMETFKIALAFPMYGTVIWLVWILSQQTGTNDAFFWLLGGIFLSFSVWLWGRLIQKAPQVPSFRKRSWVTIFSLASIGIAAYFFVPGKPNNLFETKGVLESTSLNETEHIEYTTRWISWTPEKVQEFREKGYPVFVDFTAAWCITCQLNKKMVLEKLSIIEKMQQMKIIKLRADWTLRDAKISKELERWSRAGVPLYLLFRPCNTNSCLSKDPANTLILPELLTEKIFSEALNDFLS